MALAAYQEALAIVREVGNQAGEGYVLNGIGGLYYTQKQYAKALEVYQQALSILREVGNQTGEASTLDRIGTIYEIQERYVEALDTYQQALGILEEIRAVAGNEAGRVGFIAHFASLYTRAAALFHQQGQDEIAFATSERGRARALLDSLATGHIQLNDNAAAELLTQEQEAYTQRQATQDALAKARALNPSDPDLVADLEVQLAKAEAAYTRALTAIESRGGQLTDLVSGRKKVLGVSEVQALLDEQTTLLSYSVLDDQTLVFLLTSGSFEVFELDVSREALTELIIDFRDAISFQDQDSELTRSLAQELYQALITPFASSLHTRQLAIIPHGSLHYLPFAALLDPETDQYLIDNYTLVTLPSASAIPHIRANTGRELTSPLILGNPATNDPTLPLLKAAESEVKAIATLYGVQPLLGQAASESALRTQAAEAGILHLAAHGIYSTTYPLYSTIALAPDEAHDGQLQVYEVYGLDLRRTDLVVLSACETQINELDAGNKIVVSAGDELANLTRAFFFAGTPTVVASLWNVDDAATAFLMERFYTHLRAGTGKAAALRQAQLETMAEYPEPYYWAAFVMSGDGGKVDTRMIPNKSNWPWSSLAEVLLIVIGVILAVGVVAVIVGRIIWQQRSA